MFIEDYGVDVCLVALKQDDNYAGDRTKEHPVIFRLEDSIPKFLPANDTDFYLYHLKFNYHFLKLTFAIDILEVMKDKVQIFYAVVPEGVPWKEREMLGIDPQEYNLDISATWTDLILLCLLSVLEKTCT